mgnify:CR=1 FL=1
MVAVNYIVIRTRTCIAGRQSLEKPQSDLGACSGRVASSLTVSLKYIMTPCGFRTRRVRRGTPPDVPPWSPQVAKVPSPLSLPLGEATGAGTTNTNKGVLMSDDWQDLVATRAFNLS